MTEDREALPFIRDNTEAISRYLEIEPDVFKEYLLERLPDAANLIKAYKAG